LHEKSNTVTA